MTPDRPGAADARLVRGRPVAVLGLARSGVALARFFAARGAQVTVYDGRSRRSVDTRARADRGTGARLMLGPDVDPRAALDGQALIATSPSINSRYPTTEPRLRAALGRARGRRRRACRQRGRPVPAPVPGDDDWRNRDEGQDDDFITDRGRSGRRAGAGRAGRQHRHPARRATARS